jgi:colicin import membrane protein
MKKIILLGVTLFTLLTTSQVHAQKKESKKTTTQEVKKETKDTKQPTTAPATAKSGDEKAKKTKTVTTTTTKDKEVGKDAQGRTLYEGPKGGRYYLTKDGKKVYVKKS